MNQISFIRAVIMTIVSLFLFGNGVFASSEEISSPNNHISSSLSGETEKDTTKGVITDKKIEDSQKDENEKDYPKEDGEDKEKVQKEINAYILEAYKIQGNKILRDIDTSLQKISSDNETRVQAYSRIQKTLEMRKKRVQNMELSDNNKTILLKYLDYLISLLKKRQLDLKE